MNRFLYGVLGVLSFFPLMLWAGTMGVIVPEKTWTWFGTVSAGPVWTSGDKTQTFFLAPETEKTYQSSDSRNAVFAGELFLGAQRTLSERWLGQLGLWLVTTSGATFDGFIWDDANIAFNNYKYDYQVRHSAVGAKGRLLFKYSERVLPWVNVGLGAGFNKAYKFTNTPLIFEAVRTSNFTKNDETTFTYALGLGAQVVLTAHCQIGAGYEFSDWGRSELGRAAGQTLNTGLKIGHIYSNGILFNLTYLV